MADSMLGVMQGRLSPVRNGRIQCFPWATWEDEFPLAKQIGFECLEWTIDSERISDNPLYCNSGLKAIKELIENTGLKVESVTCDFFMENPPWESALAFEFNVNWLNRLVSSSEQVGISYIVIPLVDNSSIKQDAHPLETHATCQQCCQVPHRGRLCQTCREQVDRSVFYDSRPVFECRVAPAR